jgi:negative regulator of flagellin synthesis FlgM
MAINIKQVDTAANSHIGKASANKTDAQASQTSGSASSISTPPKSDSVSITSKAQQLQNIQSKLGDIPEVDKKKVAEIKLAIAEGRYKVDPEKLASNIAMFENELKDLN